MGPPTPLLAACLGLLLAASTAAAADDQATDQESQALLLKIEHQLARSHFNAPPDDNAVSTWQEFLTRAAPDTPGATRALTEFAERMRSRASVQVLKGNLEAAADLQAFGDMADSLLGQQRGKATAHQLTPDLPISADVLQPLDTSHNTLPLPKDKAEAAAPPVNTSSETFPVPKDKDAAAAFLSRGDALLAIKDISGARKLYEYAANLGNASAAMAMGRTLDPDYLNGLGAVGLQPDSERAVSWYRKAAALGNHDAELRLQAIGVSE
jgi:TPR repeat protein